MAKQEKKQSITKKNLDDFLGDFQSLMDKYNLHEEGMVLLRTSNLNFEAENLRRCPPECRQLVQYCDINHRNCRIVVECNCDH